MRITDYTLYKVNRCKLSDVQSGELFVFADTDAIALMTEYRDEDGRPHAYLLDSGEVVEMRDGWAERVVYRPAFISFDYDDEE